MKGISNVITVVFLLGIAVSISALYSNWAPTFSENITQKAVDQTNHEIKCDNADLSIEDPVYDESVNATIFDLRNSGTIRFTDTIRLAALNSSEILNETTVADLGVGESVSKRIQSQEKPSLVMASSVDCPSLKASRTSIRSRS